MHHVSIRTGNIHQAITFYQHLGFTVEERFTTGYTLACWMVGLGGRIELIQIPQPKPPVNCWDDEQYVGYYHLSFDVTGITPNLSTWLQELQDKLQEVKILLPPQQQMIGDNIYEVAFIADNDGLPIEFIHLFRAHPE